MNENECKICGCKKFDAKLCVSCGSEAGADPKWVHGEVDPPKPPPPPKAQSKAHADQADMQYHGGMFNRGEW